MSWSEGRPVENLRRAPRSNYQAGRSGPCSPTNLTEQSEVLDDHWEPWIFARMNISCHEFSPWAMLSPQSVATLQLHVQNEDLHIRAHCHCAAICPSRSANCFYPEPLFDILRIEIWHSNDDDNSGHSDLPSSSRLYTYSIDDRHS